MSEQFKMKTALLYFSLAAAGIAGIVGLAGGPKTGPRDAVLLLIRHADKPDFGPGLSSQGEARARAYVSYFSGFKMDGAALKLDAIYATADSKASARPRLTVEPLASTLKLPVQTPCKADQVGLMAATLRGLPKGQQALVCWHHGEMADLLRELGADPVALLPKGKWPGEVFDWVLQLTFDAEGRIVPARTRRIAAPLLPGDTR